MRVRLLAQPVFTGTLYHSEFKNGESVSHIDEHTFKQLYDVIGFEPQWIEDTDCSRCEEYKARIAELEARLTKKGK